MSTLILTIISTALGIVLAISTMYHGGDSLSLGRTSADATAYVTGAQQVATAVVLYDSFIGSLPVDVSALTVGFNGRVFLATNPMIKKVSPTLDLGSRQVRYLIESVATCKQINIKAGIPSGMADSSFNGLPYGCANIIGATPLAFTGEVHDVPAVFAFKF